VTRKLVAAVLPTARRSKLSVLAEELLQLAISVF
jgi:hypothetical protein